jgi:hypothetical protein
MSSTSPSEQPKTNNTPPFDFGWNLNQTLNQLIGFADTKAAALLAAAGVIFTLLLSNKPTHFPSGTTTIMYGLALGCLALCALCAGCAFLPFIPFRRRENKQNLVFWKYIRHRPLDKYKELVGTLDNSDVNKYYARKNHEISKDLLWRFVLVECSIASLLAGLVFAAIFYFLPK